MWAVYTGHYRITKEPMTEYAANMAREYWKAFFANVEVKELILKVEEPLKPKKKRRRRMCFG